MDMDLKSILESCMNLLNSELKKLNTLNIVLIGKTGVGKSTLINAIFRKNLAETGIGRPVTQRMRRYSISDFPLSIYDTKGFELGRDAQQEVKKELLKTIREGAETGDISRAIHCIWYCISVPSGKYEAEEIRWIKEFTSENSKYKTPVFIVLTQAYDKDRAQKMKKMLDSENLDVAQVVPVLAQEYDINNEYHVDAYGTDKLVQAMQNELPEELHKTLVNVQQASLTMKQKMARAAVTSAAVSAAAAGAAPIPFSDAAILVPIEITMMASITAIFGFEVNKSIITSLVSTVVGTSGATFAGRAFVGNLMKMIPALGSLAGGVISGATAAMLTTALGEAYIGVMTAIFKGEINAKDLGTEIGKKKLGEMLKKELKKKKR